MLGPLPPYARLTNFLPESDRREILEWVLANSAEFKAAVVTKGQHHSENQVDHEKRIALTTRNLGPFEPMLRNHLLGALKRMVALTGTPFSSHSLELEFAAHGDGAFFAPHTDISTGMNRKPLSDAPGQDRLISAVYYFHREPKAFSDGALRLYRFGSSPTGSGQEPTNHTDLEPLNNSLIAFPSTVLHEVRPVQCPTADFKDYRFALNCWYCRAL